MRIDDARIVAYTIFILRIEDKIKGKKCRDMGEEKEFYAYFGGYGEQYWWNLLEPNIKGNCRGITVCAVNYENGNIRILDNIEGLESPATLCFSPDQKYLYAANEVTNFKGTGFGGGVSALVLEDGKLRVINQSLAYGSSTAYVTTDKTGEFLMVANHGSYYYCSNYEKTEDGWEPKVVRDEGCVTLFQIREDGGIGKPLQRFILEGTGMNPFLHASAHPHSVVINENDFVIIPNKGGDNIYVCKLDREKKQLVEMSVCETGEGSSPRHAVFAQEPYVLVINEYDAHIVSYYLDGEGKLTPVSSVALVKEEKVTGQRSPWGVDVRIHPNGKFVYCNTSNDRLTVLAFDKETGKLSEVGKVELEEGGMSRGMQIDRLGRYLIVTCVLGNKAICFSLSKDTGIPVRVSEIVLPTPTAAVFSYK